MGLLPGREKHSGIGLTSQTPQDFMNRIFSERAAATWSGGKAAPVTSSRNSCPPLSGPPPPKDSDCAGPSALR
eukprot:2187987-Alexandrium_andersonii.AAC.1